MTGWGSLATPVGDSSRILMQLDLKNVLRWISANFYERRYRIKRIVISKQFQPGLPPFACRMRKAPEPRLDSATNSASSCEQGRKSPEVSPPQVELRQPIVTTVGW
ncbi:hypothetical protein C1280_06050 [Gemmata obscuriglobus]|uniref:Uncharacterized protein n=1 Tax=Gemmata obscuriglobus TaxID=114 RepID=A0A2Z3GTN3_9BACT|nr:hypothetical protein C1280_06050 [Gemmata obscuriglobus]